MRIAPTVSCLALLLAAWTAAAAEPAAFTPLFNGKDLTGWAGDPQLWSVEDGALAGMTDGKTVKHNTFLRTEKTYRNFVLKVTFKLRNHNSGIQFRSKAGEDFVVTGYQADIAESRYTGILYEEGGRGIIADVADPKEVATHVKPGDWNQYVITCNGPEIKEEINGFTTVTYSEKSDKGATEGVIAFQLHVGPGMKVWFKDVEIQELP